MQTNQITEGKIAPQLLAFFFPIWFGTFFQQLYNTVDAVVVGNYVGKQALAAVGGAAAIIMNLLVGFFVGLSSGATVIISQYYGARNAQNVSRAVHTAVALSVAGGVVLAGVGLACGPAVLRLMNTPESVMQDSVLYLRVCFIGIVFNLIYNVGSGILRAVGDSRRPLYFLIVCSVSNALLDILFVAVLRWGVFGAALATVLAQVISAALVLICLCRANASFKLYLSQVRPYARQLAQIVRIGIPAGLQSVLYTVSNMVIQTGINGFGTDALAAWSAYGKIDGIFWMTISSFGVAITTFVGQNFGAGKIDRCKKSVRVCLLMSFAATFILSGLMLLGGPLLFRLFNKDEAVIETGVMMMRFLVPFYFTYVCIEILSGAVRGAGDALKPMLITCIGVCVLRVVWVTLAVPVWHSLQTVCFSYPITWTITSILFIIYYRCGGWLRRGKTKPAASEPPA